MANTLSSYDRAILVEGQTSTGIRVPLLVAADGTLQTSGTATNSISGTFVNKPAAPAAGSLYFATDLGTGILMTYTGTKWKPATGSAVLVQVGTPTAAVTGTTSETNIAFVSIPAGLLSANGSLRVTPIVSVNNNANAKTFSVKFGTASGTTGNTFATTGLASLATGKYQILISNAGSVFAQSGVGNNQAAFGTSAAAAVSAANNTANATFINMTGTLATGTDSILLTSYSVEWLEP